MGFLFFLVGCVGVYLILGGKVKSITITRPKWSVSSKITLRNLRYWLLAIYLIHLHLFWFGAQPGGDNELSGLGMLFIVVNFHWFFIVTMLVGTTSASHSWTHLYIAYFVVGGSIWFLLGWFVSFIARCLKGADGDALVLIDFDYLRTFLKKRNSSQVKICSSCRALNNPTFNLCWSCKSDLSLTESVLQSDVKEDKRRGVWQTILCITNLTYIRDPKSAKAACLFFPFTVFVTVFGIVFIEGKTSSPLLEALLGSGFSILLLGVYVQRVVWVYFEPENRVNGKMLPLGLRLFLYSAPVMLLLCLIVMCLLFIPFLFVQSAGFEKYFQELASPMNLSGFVVKAAFFVCTVILSGMISALSYGVVYRYFYQKKVRPV